MTTPTRGSILQPPPSLTGTQLGSQLARRGKGEKPGPVVAATDILAFDEDRRDLSWSIVSDGDEGTAVILIVIVISERKVWGEVGMSGAGGSSWGRKLGRSRSELAAPCTHRRPRGLPTQRRPDRVSIVPLVQLHRDVLDALHLQIVLRLAAERGHNDDGCQRGHNDRSRQ